MKVEARIGQTIRLDKHRFHIYVRYRPSCWFWSEWYELDDYCEREEQAALVANSILAGNLHINRYGVPKHSTTTFRRAGK